MKNHFFILLAPALFSFLSCVSTHHDGNDSEASNDDDSVSVHLNLSNDDSLDFNDPDYITERRQIGLGKAKSARVDLKFPAGILSVKGGTEELAQVAVKYKKNQREFNITQELEGDHLKAKVNMPYLEGIKELKDDGSVCSVRLNEKIPMDLNIEFGAGKARMELSAIQASQITFGLGAGDFNVNLMNSPVTELKVDAGVGKATFDLSGERKKDLDAHFNCGIGSLNLSLPSKVGVKISISGLLGDIDSGEFIRKGGNWYNDAWEKDGPKIRVNINGGIGDIKLSVK